MTLAFLEWKFIEDAYGDAPPPPFAALVFLESFFFDRNAVVCFSLVPWGCLFAPVFSKVDAVPLTL